MTDFPSSPETVTVRDIIHHHISGHLHPDTAKQIADRLANILAGKPGVAPTPAEVTDEMLERATAAFYEQQEGPINFTAGMRAALTAALSDTLTVPNSEDERTKLSNERKRLRKWGIGQ